MALHVRTWSVVVVAGAAVGGELSGSPNPNDPAVHRVDVPNAPNGRLVDAWWTPLHNIPAIGSFPLLDVEPADAHQVDVKVSGSNGGRLRIKIHALYEV